MNRPAWLLLLLPLWAAPLAAQRARLHSTTTARYVELMPLRLDSSGDFTSGPLRSAAPLTQDLEVSAWGFGIPGLRGYGLVRLRDALGSELVWPRSNDHVDITDLFVELERDRWRGRLGRQQRVSGLGVYTFDGASALWRARPELRVEGFLGRGLARGFLEPLGSDAIRSLDPLRTGEATLFFGLSASGTPLPGWTAAATWQKELLADRSGIVSERVAFDASGAIGARWRVRGSLDGDLAAEAVGRARLSVAWRGARGGVEGEVFRYRPVFDLTTIWGVFSPEGHEGAAIRADARLAPGVVLDGGVTVRHYRPTTETTPFLTGVGNTSTVLELGARWTRQALSADATWRLRKGYGGSTSEGDAGVAWSPPDDRWDAGLRGSVFGQVEQFRVAEGTVAGLAAHGRLRLLPRLGVRGELAKYWHHPTNGDVAVNWSQLRAMIAVDWVFGADADRAPSYR